ncbi:MAG: hypothetical protein FWC59_03880 [Actinomycetia bacterium]|nr:hypothetical protein [Actinomycetes bacterium]
MAARSFQVDLVTPEAQLFFGPADFVAIPAWDGEVGFLRRRAPLMSALAAGELRITPAGSSQAERFAVQGGYAGTDGDHLVILATRARNLADIDRVTLRTQRADLAAVLGVTTEHDPQRLFLEGELSWLQLLDRLVSKGEL